VSASAHTISTHEEKQWGKYTKKKDEEKRLHSSTREGGCAERHSMAADQREHRSSQSRSSGGPTTADEISQTDTQRQDRGRKKNG
jgi:hypothetical protein